MVLQPPLEKPIHLLVGLFCWVVAQDEQQEYQRCFNQLRAVGKVGHVALSLSRFS